MAWLHLTLTPAGYGASSPADGNLYLYDLSTNSYLDTFSPPSTWSTSSSSASPSSSPAAQAVIPTNAVTSQTTLLTFTQTTTFQSVYPTVVTDAQGVVSTSTVTSNVLTSTIVGTCLATIYEVTLSSGETSTVYPSAMGAVSAAGSSTSDDTWDPATWTGVVPGYATLTTSGRSSSTGSAGSGGSSSDGNTWAGTNALSSKEKAAIGVGTVLGVLALATGALVVLVRRRKRSRDADVDDETEKAGLADPRSRDTSDLGTWSSAFEGAGNLWDDFTGRDRKRTKLYGKLSEKFAGLGAAVVGGSATKDGLRDREGVANRRWGMLDDEDTRRFETYPPRSRQVSQTRTIDTDGEESPKVNPFTDAHSAGQAGMGIFARSSSFAPTPEDYEIEDRIGDLGYGRLEDDDDAVVPVSYDVEAASGLAAGSMKRSAATNNFHPNARLYSDGIPSDASHPSFESQGSSNVAHAYVAPNSTSVFPPPSSFSSTVYPQAAPSRSSSNAGWRKVLGLNVRAKSPPPPSNLTNLPPSVLVMGSRMRDLRDPATPPFLGFDEDLEKGQWSGQRRRTSYGKLGHGKGQDASMSSLTSARKSRYLFSSAGVD